MLFKDLKSGYPVYFLDKTTTKYYQGKVISVAAPRYDNTQLNGLSQHATSLVVDVTIEADGTTRTYTIPETSTLTYAANIVLSTDKDGIIREVESIRATSEDILSQVETHKEKVTKCNTLLEELNPIFAEKRAQDKRIENIESEVRSLGNIVKDFINEFRK